MSVFDVTGLTTGALLVAAIIIAIIWYHKNAFSYWDRKGVKGPRPIPVFGTDLPDWTVDGLKRELENFKKYGKIYGAYEGTEPILKIADPDVASQIFCADFDSFPYNIEPSGNCLKHFLFALRGDSWRYVRALISPTFSSGKIKRMFKFFNICADDLVAAISEEMEKYENNPVINLRELYGLFAMDTITTCCYGIKLERKAGVTNVSSLTSRNDFAAAVMKVFHISRFRLLAYMLIPAPIQRLIGLALIPDSTFEPIRKRLEQLIAVRRNSAKKFDDYLQLLLDAQLDGKDSIEDQDTEENKSLNMKETSMSEEQKKSLDEMHKTRRGLSDQEIIGSALAFIVVGLDTTAATLAHCTYALAFHQDIQARLHEEIMKIAEFDEDKRSYTFSYESITSCAYLDAVVSEALRLLSPALHVNRQSAKPYHIKKYNIDIPADMYVRLCYYGVHNSPDYWDEPTRFNPDRFMPSNKDKIYPNSFTPFGLGPRLCIGMRFSLSEMKLALAKVLVRFRLYPIPGTEFPGKPRVPVTPLFNILETSVRVEARTR